MFTQYTFEDWLAAPEDKRELIGQIISAYKTSHDFRWALIAQSYFNTENTEIKNKYIVQLDAYEMKTPAKDPVSGETLLDPDGKPIMETKAVKKETKVAGTRLSSGFFFRFVTQECQHLLGNGVTLKDSKLKDHLGRAFDTTLSKMGEHALVDGVCWGFWNNNHLEEIRAVVDGQSGAVALVSEEDSTPRVVIQFWRLEEKKPLFVRVFEPDGVTLYKSAEDGNLTVKENKRAYKRTVVRDNAGPFMVSEENHPFLPVIPLYANPERRSELTEAIKSKIDCFDRIASDFGDNLQMANDIYWVLNNFGGTSKEILATLAQIKELRAVANISDGTGSGSTAEPHTFEVPYAARQTALDILRRELYRDAMALDIETLTGSSLSTEAIETASKELNLKCDRFEWCVFEFVQNVLLLAGVESERIVFKRQNITNTTQTIENIYLAASDLDQRTRLKMNPMIPDDDIDAIMKETAVERTTGIATMEQLKAAIAAEAGGGEDDAGQS